MILYYALGGGVGHIIRALAVLHTLNIRENVLIVSTVDSSFLKPLPRTIQFAKPPLALCNDPNKLTAYIQQLINENQPSELMVDSFPLGIVGELKNINYFGTRTYLARILTWDRYSKCVGNQFYIYDRTLVLEPLHEDHQYIVDRISEMVLPLDIIDPPLPKPLPFLQDVEHHWLILHSGPDEEINDLINYAKQIRNIELKQNPLLLVSPSAINKWSHQQVMHKRFFPAHQLMPFVDKIITACGCNTMRQAKQYRHKHHFFPFSRRYDDQYFRAAFYRNNTEDRKQQENAGNARRRMSENIS